MKVATIISLVFEIIFGSIRRQHFENFEQIYFSKSEL